MKLTLTDAQPQLEDFIERNRCHLFVKYSESGDFEPACDSLRVVGAAMPAEFCPSRSALSNSGGEAAAKPHRFFVQLAVLRRTDYRRCLGQLFDLSLRKERQAWLLFWLLPIDQRFLARLDADRVILQGALMHRGFWVTARRDTSVVQKLVSRSEALPRWDSLLPQVKPMLGRMPDRMLSVSFCWVPRVRSRGQRRVG